MLVNVAHIQGVAQNAPETWSVAAIQVELRSRVALE